MEDLSSWKERFEECIYAKKLLDKLHYLNTKVVNPINLEEIKKGIYYARKYHGIQMRKSGDPYYSHPIEEAIMVVEFTAIEIPKLYTSAMMQAALLHDTIEDTELTEKMITEIFGEEVAKHVEGLTRVKPYGKISAEESLNILVKQKRYDTVLIKLSKLTLCLVLNIVKMENEAVVAYSHLKALTLFGRPFYLFYLQFF
ncbi:HD domain-containing protein [Rickettsia endosymbiont of Nabis limbatus]|uniref:HD domain-containing protein n=1 Tax=Rickettsia endosymbiont of Nabis limbatus TaxID=3066268 RepID=UPI003AF36C0B